MNWKSYCLGLITAYFLVAIMTGASANIIPAMNWWGATYAGAVWPVQMFCAASQLPNCSAYPPSGSSLANSFFTFEELK